MRVRCIPNPAPLDPSEGVAFSLFCTRSTESIGQIGVQMRQELIRAGVEPSHRAWDFLAFALSASAADRACHRNKSPDGWTRQIRLEVAVTEPSFWSMRASTLEATLRFLTGDIWNLRFVPDGIGPPRRVRGVGPRLRGDSVCLLSGGVDSLVGAIDVCSLGGHPLLVSQVSRGDKERQSQFARTVGANLSHLQLSHPIQVPGPAERSQRSRSVVFLAYGVLAASALDQHRRGDEIELFVPENGFVSLNVPLTPLRIGSLSTRTTHPYWIKGVQDTLDAGELRIKIRNPYRFRTKGEMLLDCKNQQLLENLSFQATSCSRFLRYKYRHCGRCVPCLVRRAAFLHWGLGDRTVYQYDNLSTPGSQYQGFDDVRSVAMAALRVAENGVREWAGDALNEVYLDDATPYVTVARRGIEELQLFLQESGVI